MATTVTFPYTRCLFGVATRDVTPPVGIYARSWGAASHDAAEGVHRPCLATAALVATLDGHTSAVPADRLQALVAVDLGWFQHMGDAHEVLATVRQRTGLRAEALLINMSHTHASANANSQLADVPGAEFVKPYLLHLADQIAEAILDAHAQMAPAWVAYAYGQCALAKNRDYWDAAAQRYACGFNPDQSTDETLLVARVTADDGTVRATLFNYGCHPTTLAWQNRLLSPDFVGGARDVLEAAFGAPALFLQGASGETAPRDNYVGDTTVADRNGRQLGHAAAAALEGLPAAGTKFVYTGIMPSGTDLGTWAYQPCSADELQSAAQLQAWQLEVELERKRLPPIAELNARLAGTSNRREQELIRRRLFIQMTLGESDVHRMPFWVWRLGDAVLVALPNELYTMFQMALREHFPDRPVFVLTVTNGTLGYLSPRDTYGKGVYQEQQSPYAPGCLERMVEAAIEAVEELF
jgi:hypothetical protein